MSRPKFRPTKSTKAILAEIVTFGFLLFTAYYIYDNYSSVPELIEIPFNWPSTNGEGFTHKSVLWQSFALNTFLILGIYVLSYFPWVYNYPTKITEENAPYNYSLGIQLFRNLNVVLSYLCFMMIFSTIQHAFGYTNTFYKHPTFISLALIFIIIGISIFKMIKGSKALG